MRERPILFSGPMVRAILDGRKTQTRRIVTTRHPLSMIGPAGTADDPESRGWFFDGPGHHGWAVLARGKNERHDHGMVSIPCPYGAPGDRLWVREAWNVRGLAWGKKPSEAAKIASRDAWQYRATDDGSWQHGWKPGIHMPRAASRILLEVTDVRVERLQAISEEDARAEGIERSTDERWPWRNYDPADGAPFVHATTSFQSLWSSINGPESWSSNPWVWVVSFRRLDAPRAQLAREATIVPQEVSRG